MSLRNFLFVLALSLLVYGSGSSTSGRQNVTDLQVRLRDLASSVENGNVARIDVLQFPPDILTRAGLSPQMLEEQYYYKLTIERRRGASPWTRLTNALKSTSVEPDDVSGDLRWAVVFYSGDGKRIGAIYFDAGGRHGYVDKTRVSLKGDLLSSVQAAFASWR
jgi:hypothetical protein